MSQPFTIPLFLALLYLASGCGKATTTSPDAGTETATAPPWPPPTSFAPGLDVNALA